MDKPRAKSGATPAARLPVRRMRFARGDAPQEDRQVYTGDELSAGPDVSAIPCEPPFGPTLPLSSGRRVCVDRRAIPIRFSRRRRPGSRVEGRRNFVVWWFHYCRLLGKTPGARRRARRILDFGLHSGGGAPCLCRARKIVRGRAEKAPAGGGSCPPHPLADPGVERFRRILREHLPELRSPSLSRKPARGKGGPCDEDLIYV